MQQPYWNLAWNLWALALSTVIALFLPDFGPSDRMNGGVGVVIRTTMAAPVVFTLLYWAGWLATYLTNRLKKRWRMTTFFAGIQDGIAKAAEKRAKEMVDNAVDAAVLVAIEQVSVRLGQETAARVTAEAVAAQASAAAEKAIKDRESEREEYRKFLRNKGVSEEEIKAFFHTLSNQG